jgi:protein-disulfide isomerase
LAQAQEQPNAAVAERLRGIEASQAELMTQLKILQSQIAELNARLLALTAPPSRPTPLPVPAMPLSLKGAPTKGAKEARVVLIEFSDFQCPFCGRFVAQTYPEIFKTYVQTGKVLFAFRHLPLSAIHPFALKGSQAASCADDQGRFWEMHDLLFQDQGHLDDTSLRMRAQNLKLELNKFEECFSGRTSAKVQADLATAKTLQLSATPAFIIGRVQADGSVKAIERISGAQAFPVFKAALDKALAQ